MSTKKFFIKTFIKTCIVAIISIIALALLRSPVITNNIALGQLENSDAFFVLWEMYNKFRSFTEVVYSLIVLWYIGTVGYDTYKFFKTKDEGEDTNEVS